MTRLTKLLPLLMLLAAIWCVSACDHDEPRNRHTGNGNTIVTNDTTGRVNPSDTTRDTTGNVTPKDTIGTDTTNYPPPPAAFTITLNADRDYAYMGQSLQVNAITSETATVKWRSTNTLVATVNNEGLVMMANVRDDCETHIIATANNMSDSLLLHNRVWHVAMKENNAWITEGTRKVHPGDTILMTIVNSSSQLINDEGFNAGTCQWTVTCREADVDSLFSAIEAPSQANGWQAKYVVAPVSPLNVTFSIQVRYNEAATALSCMILP